MAYFASVALLALAASKPPAVNGTGDATTYFDSVVFLTMFLLFGESIPKFAYRRHQPVLFRAILGSIQ